MDSIMIIRAIIVLPILFFIPGNVIFNAFKLNDINIKLSFFETVFLQIVVSIIFTGWIAFILAMFGYFSLWIICGLILICSVIVAIKFKVKTLFNFPKPAFRRDFVFLTFIALISLSCYSHPFEFDIFHFREAGENINMGISLAKHGTINVYDDFFASIPPKYKPIFFIEQNNNNDAFSLFPTYKYSIQENVIKPEYFQFYPMWIGILYLIFGLNGVMYINSFFMLLSLFAFYYFVSHTFNNKIAIVSTPFFAFSFFQIYFSWYHGNETISQLLILLSMLTFIYFLKSGHFVFAIFSVMALLETVLTRIDNLFLVFGLLLFLLFDNTITKKNKILLYAAMFVLSPIIIIYYFYFYERALGYATIFNNLSYQIIILLIFGGILFLIPTIKKSLLIVANNFLNLTEKKYTYILLLLFLLFLILGAFSYSTDREFENLHNLESLSWYVGTSTIIFYILGFIYFLKSAKTNDQVYVAFLYTPYALFFLAEIHNYVLHPWVMRRYLSLIFPFTVVFFVYFITKYKFNIGKQYRNIFLISIIFTSVVSFLIPMIPLFDLMQKEATCPSVIEQVENINAYFPEKSIIIFNVDSYEYSPAFPLRIIYDRNTILMPRPIVTTNNSRAEVLDEETIIGSTTELIAFVEMCKIWQENGHLIFIINPSDKFIKQISSFENAQLLPQKTFEIEFYNIPLTYNKFAPYSVRHESILQVYSFQIRDPQTVSF